MRKLYNLDKNRYLEVKNLSFRYDNKNSQPLKNINFEIKKGEFIGITGKTGSGKSTLFLILMGLLKPEGGVVSHYGQNINKDERIWKKKLGYVSQNIFLLNGSLKKNILLNFDSLTTVPFLVYSVLFPIKKPLLYLSLAFKEPSVWYPK